MLKVDQNHFIAILFNKSAELNRFQESGQIQQEEESQEEIDDEQRELENEEYSKKQYACQQESDSFNNKVYGEFKKYKANDIYIFEKDPNLQTPFVTKNEIYIPYEEKKYLQQAINNVMKYQEENNLIDYHPNINDLSGEIQKQVEREIEANLDYEEYNCYNSDGEEDDPQFIDITDQIKTDDLPNANSNQLQKIIFKKGNTPDIARIRNILHQSLQSFSTTYCKSDKLKQFKEYFDKCKQNNHEYDQWGKIFKTSPSEFLWLPAQFLYNKQTSSYQIEGDLFKHLQNYPFLDELKEELSNLLTYFSDGLKQTHEYFSSLNYNLMGQYFKDQKFRKQIYDNKSSVNFDERIHAIVKISEMEIQPYSIYNGQWHVEGFSSDNILYTCLYVIEQDSKLVNGELHFKRAPRSDDVPVHPMQAAQSAHQYCPDYEYLCSQKDLIPLGYLQLKEDLMVIFPNQNIHRVINLTNNTDKPLKRKIVAFFIVNHVEQPFTINDIDLTMPLSDIKEQRLRDMFERSKNKQTNAQSFNYCEH